MAAPKGNKYWKLANNIGANKKYKTPELLWEACCKYFKWCDENPLVEMRQFHYQGKVTEKEHYHPRPYNIGALCLHIGTSSSYLDGITAKEFSSTLTRIRAVCYHQKFDNATAGLMNAQFIGKAIGLVEQTKVDLEAKMIGIDPKKVTIEYLNIDGTITKD